MLPERIELTLTKRDFKDKSYANPFDCPVATGLKRMFPDSSVGVSFGHCDIDGETYEEFTECCNYHTIQPFINKANSNKKVGKLTLIFEKI
jgi:hypothetical protein